MCPFSTKADPNGNWYDITGDCRLVYRCSFFKALRAPVHPGRGPRVWLHCMLGTRPRFLKDLAASQGSVSPEAVRLCRENGITVIPGSCPMQFLGADFGHTCMRGILRMTGALELWGPPWPERTGAKAETSPPGRGPKDAPAGEVGFASIVKDLRRPAIARLLSQLLLPKDLLLSALTSCRRHRHPAGSKRPIPL